MDVSPFTQAGLHVLCQLLHPSAVLTVLCKHPCTNQPSSTDYTVQVWSSKTLRLGVTFPDGEWV